MKHLNKKSNFDKYYKDFVPLIKKEQSQKYLFIILSISASIFFLIFAINPTLSTIGNLNKQIDDARLVESKLSEKVNSLSNLSQQYIQIEDDIPFILDAIPESPEVPTLVGQLRAIGESSSVAVDTINVLPVILTSGNASNSSSFLFEISGNSNFENTQTFLSNITNMQRAIALRSIQITRSKKEQERVDFVIKGEAYFKK